MPDKRPKPRGESYRHTAFFVTPWALSRTRRDRLNRLGVPEPVIIAIENRLSALTSYLNSDPPTPKELRAALEALKRPASTLLAALGSTDAQTLAYLRRYCDV